MTRGGPGDMEQAALVAKMMAGVKTVTRKPPAESVGPPPSKGSVAAKAFLRLKRVVAGLTPSDIPEALSLVRALAGFPNQQAEALCGLAAATGAYPQALAVACRAYALAARLYDEVGRPNEARGCAEALTALAPNDTWRDYAARLLTQRRVISGTIQDPTETRLLRELKPALQARIAANLQLRTYPRGDYLCVEHNPAEEMFLLRSGKVAVLHEVEGRPRFLRLRYPRDTIGEMAALSPNRQRTATVQAVEPTEAWVLGFGVLDALLASSAELRTAIEHRYVERRLESRLLVHPLFATLDMAERAAISAAAVGGRRFSAGDVLRAAGAPVETLLMVLDGALVVSDPTLGETRVPEGDAVAPVLGAWALLGDGPALEEVRAEGPGWVVELPVSMLRARLQQSPAFEAALAAWLLP